MVFGSTLAVGPVAGGVVSRRRRTTSLMRAISCWACGLSETFWPMAFVSPGSRVSSRYASKVRRVKRTGVLLGFAGDAGRLYVISGAAVGVSYWLLNFF